VLEIGRFRAALVECHASARALDALTVPAGTHLCRVTPDELLLLGAPERLDELLRRAIAQLAVVEPGGLVVDQSDGWTIFSLPGEAGLLALRQLSFLPIPERRPAFLQGSVAGGPAKLLFLDGLVHLLVPFALRDHLAGRLRDVLGVSGIGGGVGGVGTVRVADAEAPFVGGSRSA
jgi:hypothetical protein